MTTLATRDALMRHAELSRSGRPGRYPARPARRTRRSGGGRTGAAVRAARRGDPALFAGSGKDSPHHAARRRSPGRPGERLPRLADPDRGRAGDQAQRQVAARRNAAGLLATAANRPLSLGAGRHYPRSRARYAALRARGCSHGRVLRGVADRLLAVACAILETKTMFDPTYGRGVAARPTRSAVPGSCFQAATPLAAAHRGWPR